MDLPGLIEDALQGKLDEPHTKILKAAIVSMPGFKEAMIKGSIADYISNYLERIQNPNPTLGDAASLFSEYAIPGGSLGAGAIALSDTAKAGGLGTVGGALAKGFEEAKAAGRTWKGLEGAQKFEISDELARYGSRQGLEYPKVGQILEHPELYKNYPETQKIGLSYVEPDMIGVGTRGSYSPEENLIRLPKNIESQLGNEEAKSTLLHEIQHAIQERENFARGGSPESMLGIQDEIPMYSELKNKLYEIEDSIGGLHSELSQKSRTTGLPLNESIRLNSFRLQNPETRKINIELKNIEDSISGISPFERYRRLAGEAESRNVQGRMNMTEAERQANPFVNTYDVPLEDQIVRMKSGRMAK